MPFADYYLLSNDMVENPPPLPEDSITFVGIGSPSFVRALYKLQETHTVKRAIAVDYNPRQLKYLQHFIRLLGEARSVPEFLEELFGICFDPGFHKDPLFPYMYNVWHTACFKNFERTTGIEFYGFDGPLPCFATPKISGHKKGWMQLYNVTDPTDYSYFCGYGHGLMRNQNFPFNNFPNIEYVQGSANDVLPNVFDSVEGPVVFWSSNLFNTHYQRGLEDYISKWSADPSIFLWGDSRIYHEWNHFCTMADHLQEPFYYTEKVIRNHVLDDAIDLLFSHDIPESNYSNRSAAFYEDYLKKPTEHDTIVVHSLLNYGVKLPTYQRIIDLTRSYYRKRLIIVEHNALSFDKCEYGSTPIVINNLVGKEGKLHWCRGIHCHKRNFILVY